MTRRQRKALQPLGVNYDVPPNLLPDQVYDASFNVIFRDGKPQRCETFQSMYQELQVFPAPPLFALFAPQGGEGRWLVGTASGAFGTDGSSHTDITPVGRLSVVESNQWTGTLLNGLAVATNGENPPFYWDGNLQNPAVNLPDFPAQSCWSIRAYKNYLVAMNINGSEGRDEQLVLWSDAAPAGLIPDSWTPGPDSDAGNNVLADTVGPILDAMPLRDDLVIYKPRSVYLMSFIGGEAVMSFRKLFGNRGALAKNCVAEFEGKHYVLGDGDCYVHDGQNIVSVAEGRIQEFFFKNIDDSEADNCFVVIDKPNSEVHFCAPALDTVRVGFSLVYSIAQDAWTLRELPLVDHGANGVITAGVVQNPLTYDAATFPYTDQQADRQYNEGSLSTGGVLDGVLFASEVNNALYWLGGDRTDVPLTQQCALSWSDRSCGSPAMVKRTERVWLHVEAPAGEVFTVRLGGAFEPQAAPLFVTGEVVAGESNFAALAVQGRYLTVNVRYDGAQPFTLRGWELEYIETGEY